MKSDSPIVEEVRQRRHEISERYGHDLQAYAKRLREVEAENQERVVSQITIVAPKSDPKKKSD